MRSPSIVLPRLRLFCITAAVALCLSVLAVPTRSSASASASQTGAQLLQAQLPPETPLPQATDEQLTRAVSLATRAHRADAVAILTAALTRGGRKDPRATEAKLPCTRVAGLLHAAVAAAPEKASGLLELAGSLYPNGLNLEDPQVRDINLVVGGFGPGFPGAPGFVGSPASGGVALPSPVAPQVTPVVNG